MVLNNIADTDRRDHSVKDEADPSDDGCRKCVDQACELGLKAQNDRIDRCEPDDARIIHAGEHQDARVLSVGRIRRSAEEGGERGRETVADQSTVKTGLLKEILADGRGDRRHIADMLHHGSDRDRCHDQDRGDIELADEEIRQSEPWCSSGLCEVDDCASVRIGHACSMHQKGCSIGEHDTHQDRDDAEHALAPDIENDDHRQRDAGKEPVMLRIGDCRFCEGESDADDDRPGHDRGKKTHDLLYADEPDDQRENKVKKTRDDDSSAGVGKFLPVGHIRESSRIQIRYGRKASEESEG